MKRDKVIKQIRKDEKAWTSPVHILMRASVGKRDGYKLRRTALLQSLLDAALAGRGNLDALLTQAVDGDKEIDAVLCRLASILLFKLAETDPAPLKWFPKELAMHASVKLEDLADAPPPRHKGTNEADNASLNYFIITKVLYACKELNIKPTRNQGTRFGGRAAAARDSGCYIVAKALDRNERAIEEVWAKRGRFGIA
jgi:hypothetical protein